jgi:zinc protease
VPSLKTTKDKHNAYALDMLSYILDNGLSKTLVREQQIASSISVSYRLYDKYNTLFTLSFIPAKGKYWQALGLHEQNLCTLRCHPMLNI